MSLKRIALFPSGKRSLFLRAIALSYAARVSTGMCCCTQPQTERHGTPSSLTMLLYP